MSPRSIYEVLEGSDVVGLSPDFGLIVTWNRSATVRLWSEFEEGTWLEEDVVTLGGELTREAAEASAQRLIAYWAMCQDERAAIADSEGAR